MGTSAAKLSCRIGVRLTREEKDKLTTLCTHAQRGPSDLVRTLIRLAEPVHLPTMPIEVSPEQAGNATKKQRQR
jgi:hypothetical protein